MSANIGGPRISATKRWRRLIFVTGHGRGGTTWLGDLLSLAENSGYIFEPLTHKRHPKTGQLEKLKRAGRARRYWIHPWPPACSDEAELADAIAHHILELFNVYFSSPIDNLIIKQPGAEWIPIMSGVLQPDHTVYIKRHPAAILNSYDDANLYDGWRVSEQFVLCRDYIANVRRDLFHMLANVGDDPDLKILSMICVAHQLADEWASQGQCVIVNYEEMARNGIVDITCLFDRLGLRLQKGEADHLVRLFAPPSPKAGFLDTEKNSERRAAAFLNELAPWQISKARKFLQDIGYPDNVQQQRWSEASAGTLKFFRRRLRNGENYIRTGISRVRKSLKKPGGE
jgi:hypothetical protein